MPENLEVSWEYFICLVYNIPEVKQIMIQKVQIGSKRNGKWWCEVGRLTGLFQPYQLSG